VWPAHPHIAASTNSPQYLETRFVGTEGRGVQDGGSAENHGLR
jgi:hypothetical protein